MLRRNDLRRYRAIQELHVPGRQAKILSEAMLRRMLSHTRHSTDPLRDQAIILLSVKAGLRACEIAGLNWSMILDARGSISRVLTIEDRIAKRGSGRRIPLHRDLHSVLVKLRKQDGGQGPVIRSSRGGAMRPNSIVNWFVTLYDELGFDGCSSHSGRRTFITSAARNAHKAGGCLRDVQLLAGHRSLSVTQGYIDGDSDAQRRLVALI
ncbi:MAG: site-specific integrase [Aurantimonas endophytica]|uniref:tyrosine-type recombinase/integrase n=1 Tax=Aurantimonas endophytica TaxID=1522175 RepID=UPI0030024EB8